MNKIAVVGGGITGLSAAHRLTELDDDFQISVFESSSCWGGVLQTESVDGFLVEHSADMFTTIDPAALRLCQRLGLDDELIGTNSQFQRAFIAQNGELVPVPKGLNLMTPSDLEAIRQSPLLTEEGKKRFLKEESIPPRKERDDESLESFAVRRFGAEAYQKIIQPLVGGIYTADPKKLSLRATLPQYLEMEAKHGSVIAATRAKHASQTAASGNTSGARYNLFMAPSRGMASLIDAIQSRLNDVELSLQSRVSNLTQSSDSTWELQFESGDKRSFDAVILTCPARPLASILQQQAPGVAKLLSPFQYASSAIVIHGLERNSIGHALDGFGFVVPLSENRKILAGSFSSIKFKCRASEEHVLTRTFIGGGCQPELMAHSDQELGQMARGELHDLLNGIGKPLFEKVVRWENSMPQYHLGHLELVDALERETAKLGGVELAGKSYRGVGIPACIKSGEMAAERIAEYLN